MTIPEATDSTGKPPSGREADFTLLKDAVREAGVLAMSYFRRAPSVEIKPDNSPVSEADIAVDNALRETLTATRPGYGWLSEETADDPSRRDCRNVWIVDPIDGTRAFIKEKPEWTIAAALVEDGRPVLAAVFNPATEEFFEAEANAGARLNGAHIGVNDPVALPQSRLITAQSLLRRDIWKQAWPPVETRWVNSVAYRLALVACGACDGTLSLSSKHDWDIAAAELLVQEAGGRATTHTGETFLYNTARPLQQSVIAAGPALHTALLERTRLTDI